MALESKNNIEQLSNSVIDDYISTGNSCFELPLALLRVSERAVDGGKMAQLKTRFTKTTRRNIKTVPFHLRLISVTGRLFLSCGYYLLWLRWEYPP